jgi:hypothetical protein
LTTIGTLKDGSNSDFLVLMYPFGLELVGMKMADEAKTIFRAAFENREKFLGEQHPESSLFIEDLIHVYCQEIDCDFYESRRLDINFFIKELAEMCFEHGDYSKTEIQECQFPSGTIRETTAESNDRKFWSFDSRPSIQSFQGILAENYNPGHQYYWEDSRLYTRKLNMITLVPMSPNIPVLISKTPAKILVGRGGLAVKISVEYLADAQEDHAETIERDVIRKLKTYRTLGSQMGGGMEGLQLQQQIRDEERITSSCCMGLPRRGETPRESVLPQKNQRP